jgi:hypothetical protein
MGGDVLVHVVGVEADVAAELAAGDAPLEQQAAHVLAEAKQYPGRAKRGLPAG